MTTSRSSGKSHEDADEYATFDQLVQGCDVVIKAMVCRKWDAHNSFGKYLSTEFISSDAQDAEPILSYGLKQKLYKHLLDIYKASRGNDFKSSKQRQFFSLCLQEDSSMMDSYLMHSLNHVFKSRDVVMKNETRLAKNQETGKDEVLANNIFCDRGFCRPKVLILLPLASIAFRVVKRLIQLTPLGNKVDVQHMDRFTNEFGVANNEDLVDDLPLVNDASEIY